MEQYLILSAEIGDKNKNRDNNRLIINFNDMDYLHSISTKKYNLYTIYTIL